MANEIWTWRCEDESGAQVAGDPVPEGGFPTQAEAEAWLSESWMDLQGAGIAAVTLMHADEVEYGPMSLDAG